MVTTGAGNDLIIFNSIVDGGDIFTDFDPDKDKIVITQLLQSIGYKGSSAIDDGYVGFLGFSNNTVLQIDIDGSAGSATARPFALFQGLSESALNTNDIFIF
jgi:hypothetical protein